jgi:hypothetical protein
MKQPRGENKDGKHENKTQPSKQQSQSLRVTLSYEGSDVRVVTKQVVTMVPPPSEANRAEEGQSGFWYELRDGEGHKLYQRIIQNPIKFAFEVRSDPDRPLSWQKVREPRGNFVLLMPALEYAKTLVLFSSPFEPEAATKPAKEIAHFDLTQRTQGKEVL